MSDTTDAFVEALATLQQTADHHRLAIEDLRKLTHRPPAQATRYLIKADNPLRETDLGTLGVKSIALLNFSSVTVYLGIAGRSASQGNGLRIAPLSYIVLPIATNLLDVGIDAATAPAGGADVLVLKYDHVQEFNAGPLVTPGTTGSPLAADPSAASAGAPEAAVSVTNVATLLQADNPARKELRFQPTSGDIYVGFDNTVTIANGLKAAAGTIFIEDRWKGPVYAIAVAAVDVRRVELT